MQQQYSVRNSIKTDSIIQEASFTEEYQTLQSKNEVTEMLKNNLIKSNHHRYKSLPASPPPSLASIQNDSLRDQSSMNDSNNLEETKVVEKNEDMQYFNPNRHKLKLNLSKIGQYDSIERAQTKSEGGGGFYGQPIGFHQEFMAKIDEFSLSWRQAAMKEKRL